MKKLYPILGILIICFGIISGCKTLFDVVPTKDVYSPIVLEKSLIPIKISETSCKVLFRGVDAALNYGALVFYDSMAAASFVSERNTVGTIQLVSAVQSNTATIMLSDTVRFDNTKGQFLYVTPFAYKKEDPNPGLTKDYSKVFSSQRFIRLKISPWSHVTDLPGSTLLGASVFPADSNLFCVRYDNPTPKAFYGYEYDVLRNKWAGKGNFINELCQGKCGKETSNPSKDITQNATGINGGYYANNQYHLLASLFLSGENTRGLGDIVINKDFTYQSTTSYSGYISFLFGTASYSLIDIQADRALVVVRSPNTDLVSYRNGKTEISRITQTIFSTSKQIQYNSIDETFTPTIACVINNTLVANSQTQVNMFRVYDLADINLKRRDSVSYSGRNQIWDAPGIPTNVLAISEGDHAFVLNNLLNIYKVTLNATHKPVFANIYTGWFPAVSATAINKGFAFKGSLWFLVNNYELWKINPNQLLIDYNRDYSIVNL